MLSSINQYILKSWQDEQVTKSIENVNTEIRNSKLWQINDY